MNFIKSRDLTIKQKIEILRQWGYDDEYIDYVIGELNCEVGNTDYNFKDNNGKWHIRDEWNIKNNFVDN